MSDSEILKVESRETRGTQKARQMRRAGKVPAVLYGQGKDSVALALDARELSLVIRRRSKLVQLDGASKETAIFKKVQWDTFYKNVLHVDFERVDAGQLITVDTRLEVRGTAPGTKMGGTVELLARSIEIECPANVIPEVLEISVNELELDQTITAGDLELPKGAKLTGEATAVLVTCAEAVKQADEDDEVAPAATGAEPEVIGKKEGEDEGGDS